MTRQNLHIHEVKDRHDLMAFIRCPWEIYQGDWYWIPPIIKDQLQKFSPDHPFRSHAEMILMMAMKEKKPIGRIAGIIDRNYIEFHQEKTGFFGFFESIPDLEVAEILLSKVRGWLRKHGMEKMIGPMNPSTNDECGLLVEGFGTSPRLMMPYNPPYYPPLLEEWGLKKAMDLYAYWLDQTSFLENRLSRITKELTKRNPQLRVRQIELRHFNKEIQIIKDIYNNAWSKNWGFVPLTEAEINDLAKHLRPLIVPDLVSIAYWGEEPIGFSVSIPDYNEVLKHLNGKLGLRGIVKFLYYSRKIKTVRVMLTGVKRAFHKKGVEGLLYFNTFQRAIAKGYPQSECSWILENNILMQHGIEAMGGKRYKTYRIYETSL